jgi:hypothetical protein
LRSVCPRRFDLVAFVGTPALKGRVEMRERALDKTDGVQDKEAVVKAVGEAYEEGWMEHSFKYITYLENSKVIDKIVAAAKEGVVGKQTAMDIIEAQTEKMTIRDDVREEYDATEFIGRW